MRRQMKIGKEVDEKGVWTEFIPILDLKQDCDCLECSLVVSLMKL